MRALWFAALLLCSVPTSALAENADGMPTLPQYIATLEQLRQEVVSAPDSAAVLSIAKGLPSEWQTEVEDHFFSTSSDGLRQGLNAYAKQRTPANLALITAQIDLLERNVRALRSPKNPAAAERKKLEEILSRHEFHNVEGESWYDRWKAAAQQWLSRLLERIVFSTAFPLVSRIVIWALLAIAVAVAAYWVIRNYRKDNIYTKFTGSPDAVSAKPWRDWQAEAQAAAGEGRWRDAVHLSYWAGISFLEAQGLWRPDRARTPREYMRLLPASDAHHDSLRQLTRGFEQVWYGTETATAETFAGASALLEQLGCR
jgi:Domain of unknown function (DUF4129)